MNEPALAANGRAGFCHRSEAPPYALAGLAKGAAGCFLVAGLGNDPRAAIVGAALLAQAALFLHTTGRGKIRVREDEHDQLALRDDERLLDLSCGRGTVLIATAERLPTGSVAGVDLWRGQGPER